MPAATRIRLGRQPSRLLLEVTNYVRHHLSEPISVEAMAKELYMSGPYLSASFKKETGETLTDFILKEKNRGSQAPPPLFR